MNVPASAVTTRLRLLCILLLTASAAVSSKAAKRMILLILAFCSPRRGVKNRAGDQTWITQFLHNVSFRPPLLTLGTNIIIVITEIVPHHRRRNIAGKRILQSPQKFFSVQLGMPPLRLLFF